MTNPQQALSVLVCVLTAMALGVVARLPTIHSRLQAPDRAQPAWFLTEEGGGRR
ncbi:MAG TPA: hypothetical protein V6D00_16030 [Pantanalinema sp.]